MMHLIRVYKLAKKCRAQVNNYFLNENQGEKLPAGLSEQFSKMAVV